MKSLSTLRNGAMALMLSTWALIAGNAPVAPIALPQDAIQADAGIGRWSQAGSNFEKIQLLPGGVIYLKDTHTGKSNESIRFHFNGKELQAAKGCIVRFSVDIQLIKGECSIGYWGQTREKRFSNATPCQGLAFDTPKNYAVEVLVPQDAISLNFNISCAGGFGKTGEGRFSNLKFQIIPPKAPEAVTPTAAPAPVTVQKPQEENMDVTRFWLFKDRALAQYDWNPAGSPLAAETIPDSYEGTAAFRIVARKDCTAKDRILFQSIAHNRGYDLEEFSRKDGWIEFYYRPAVKVALAWHEPQPQDIHPAKNGWTKARISLKAMRDRIGWGKFHILTFSFPDGLKAGQHVEFDQISIVAPGKLPQPAFTYYEKSSEESISAAWKQLKEPLPEGTATRKMPEVRNGTYYMDGRPVFFQGPFLDNLTLSRDFLPHAYKPFLDKYPYFWKLFDKEMAAELGFNSMQLSSAAIMPMEEALGLPIRESPVSLKMEEPFYRSLKGMPVVTDFAWIYIPGVVMKADYTLPPEAYQQNSDWHQFLPFCPEHPIGGRIMREHYRSGTALMLRRHLNTFCYELFNEANYDCRCRFNREAFARKIEAEFESIDKLNQHCNTSFKSFEEVALIPRFEKIPALWMRWCKFSGDRYADMCREYKEIIRSEDPAPGIIFGEQRGSALTSREAGKDYYKLAKFLDMLATESGYKFGTPAKVRNGREAEEAADASGYRYALETDTLAALVRGKNKVLANHEHYCMRMAGDTRVPTRKSDFTTAMWMEVFHDLSASYVFNWGSHANRWKTVEDAKQLVIHGGAHSAYLLNPYAYPPGVLDGFKDFERELEPLRDIILPMPRRRQATVALLHSNPSLRMSILPPQSDYVNAMLAYYSALTTLQYPFEILFEEDATPEALSRYEMVIAPELRCSYPKTIPALLQYARQGGVVILGRPDGACFNEENQPLANGLPAMTTESAQVESLSHGKGKIYRLRQSTNAPKKLLNTLLAKHQVTRHVETAVMDKGETLDNVQVRLIDRENLKLLCIVNWTEGPTRLIQAKFNVCTGLGWRIIDPVTQEEIANPASKDGRWSGADLAKGVPVILKSQVRTLVLAVRGDSPVKPVAKITANTLQKRFEEFTRSEAAEIARQNAQMAAERRAHAEARIYRGVDVSKCDTLDLRAFVTTGFKDELAGDGKGGWFDQGVNDFRNAQVGKGLHAGVPFQVIDPATNQDKSVLILRGAKKNHLPLSVKNIPATGKFKALYILHTAGWKQPEETTVYSALLHYSDGTTAKVDFSYGVEIGDWWRPAALSGCRIAMEVRNPQCDRVGFYVCRKGNPHPGKELLAIDLISANDGSVPAIAAITLERF